MFVFLSPSAVFSVLAQICDLPPCMRSKPKVLAVFFGLPISRASYRNGIVAAVELGAGVTTHSWQLYRRAKKLYMCVYYRSAAELNASSIRFHRIGALPPPPLVDSLISLQFSLVPNDLAT